MLMSDRWPAACIAGILLTGGSGVAHAEAGLAGVDRSDAVPLIELYTAVTPSVAVALPVPPAPAIKVDLPVAPAAAAANAVPSPHAGAIASAALQHGLDPLLLEAVVAVESRGRTHAVSPKGAVGLMQLMPATARELGVDDRDALFDAPTNLEAGARHLRALQRRFPSLDLALAAYNAGAAAVERFGGRVPPYRETRDYVRGVLEHYRALRRGQSD